MPSPTNTAAMGTRPEQPLGTAHPRRDPAPGPTNEAAPQPQTPPDVSTRGRQPAARQAAATQAHPDPRPHHGPPIRLTGDHAGSGGPPTQTCTTTPADTTNARPLGAVRPHAHNPTESPSPQAPETLSASAPGCHTRAPAQAELASQRYHDQAAEPAVRRTETQSHSHPAPDQGPDPDLDPTHATVPTDTLRSSDPGSETPEAAQAAGTAAAPPAPPAKPQRAEPTVDAREEVEEPPQQTEAPPTAADLPAQGPPETETPSGGADQPQHQHADPPNLAASGGNEAPDVGQPDAGPGEQDGGRAAGLPRPTVHEAQAADRAGAAALTAPACRSDAGAPGSATSGEAPPQGPPGACARFET